MVVRASSPINEADTIPTRCPSRPTKGLALYFPDVRAVVIDSDNNSADHTQEAFLKTATRVPIIYISTAPGLQGKGNNLRNLIGRWSSSKRKRLSSSMRMPKRSRRMGGNISESLCSRVLGLSHALYVQHKYEGLVNHECRLPSGPGSFWEKGPSTHWSGFRIERRGSPSPMCKARSG